MSFHNAPVTKGLMLVVGLGSLAANILNVKHYFHMQLVPHISRHHQWWRFITSQLIFGNSNDLLVAIILLYNVGITVERCFGSRKYASFLIVSFGVSACLLIFLLVLLNRTGINYIPPGAYPMIFSILYQHYRIVPPAYKFRISGLDISNKAFDYFLAWLLIIADPPGTVLACAVGIMTGQLYRSDLVNLKSYRISPTFERFSKRFLLPLIGSTRPPRRPNTVFPPATAPSGVYVRDQTTAPAAAETPQAEPESQAGRPSVVSQWVDELTGRRGTEGAHVPTDAEITTLASVFPDVRREELVAALQRSGNVETAVESLLRTR